MRKLFFWLLLLVIGCNNVPEHEQPEISKDQKELEKLYSSTQKPFYHGVASGDPLPEKVIIWTRLTPEENSEKIIVDWEMSESLGFEKLVASGTTTATAEHDFTIKIDVEGLSPNTFYYYRFSDHSNYSPIGKTKTAPKGSIDSLKFAVVSCSNYEFGYFNAYSSLALRNDLDAILHLGDYIYEYAPGVYGDTTFLRKHLPSTELLTLDDYRMRFSQYRLDRGLQDAHKNHPFIAIWDDHEIANDAYKEGAKNHQADEGSYIQRKEAAKKAYYEWLPIRESDNLYRNFHYGNLADIIMLDERLAGRTAPVKGTEDPAIGDSTRSMLGKQQLNWLDEQLTNSKAQWKIIGNQVIFSYLNWGFPTWDINMDSWDGYPLERIAIKDIIVNKKIQNVIFATGDTHSSWAFEVTNDPFNNYNQSTGEGAFAIEFGTTSINSGNSDETMPTDSVKLHESKIVNTELNPHLKYANLRDHGYMVLTASKKTIKAEWFYVETLKKISDKVYLGKSILVDDKSTVIR